MRTIRSREVQGRAIRLAGYITIISALLAILLGVNDIVTLLTLGFIAIGIYLVIKANGT